LGGVSLEANGSTVAGRLYARVDSGNAYFTLYAVTDAGAASNITDSEVDTDFYIDVNLTYAVAS
jgi:hypothetical protein